MSYEETLYKAKELLEPFENRYRPNLEDVSWVEQDNSSLEGDYCYECAKKSELEKRKKYLLEQRKLPIEKRDAEFDKFSCTYNYGGGYESDSFRSCDTCGVELEISILPSEQWLDYLIEDLNDGNITDQIGYRCYWIIYNEWGDNKYGSEKQKELTLKLALRVIEILENGNNKVKA